MAWVFNITILGDYMFYIVFDIHALWLIKTNYQREREREKITIIYKSCHCRGNRLCQDILIFIYKSAKDEYSTNQSFKLFIIPWSTKEPM